VDQTSRIFAAAAGQDQPFATAKFANMLADPNSINDIAAYGNTVVAVNRPLSSSSKNSPNLCYSTDGGTNWFPKLILDPSNNLYDFTSVTVNTATGQFFAVAGTSVLTSTNGNIWSLASTLGVSGTTIFYFSSGPYQYVVIDAASTNIQTSSDAITWTTRSALPNWGYFVAYGNGFFIVGGAGFLRRTADFITYTTPTINELTGGLTEANFFFNGGVYKGTTFIVSASNIFATITGACVFKSTNVGVNFSLSNLGVAYYENVNNGMLVNTPDSRSQIGGAFLDTAQAISNPNRGDALSFSGATYSLRTRQGGFITTTTGSPSTTGLSTVVGATGEFDSAARTTTNVGLATVSLRYSAGQWRVTYTGSTGSSSVIVSAPSFNVNVINAYVASGASITGYPFMLNNTFIVLFPNATTTFGGTEYNGSTIYTTTDLVTWTQASSLPAAFNVSGPGSLAYIVQFLRGEYGAGGYTFLMNYGGNMRYLTTAAFTSFALANLRNPGSPSTGPLNIIKGSANDNTGAAGWIAFVGDYYTGIGQPLYAGIWLSNNIVSAGTPISVWNTLSGLDGTLVLTDNVTDVAHINSQFRVYCQFNNLLGVLSYGVLSVTTAGVVSQTINSALSNVKVLGRANSTLYVMSLTTGQVFSTTDGTTYTLRFTWNQPFLGKPVYLDSTSTVYTSGRLLTNASGAGGNTNWFTSADGNTWTKTEVTNPNFSAQSVRGVYPNKYVRASSGNYVAIETYTTFSTVSLPVVTSGSSLSNMPYKRLVTYAVPNFITSPVFYNSTLSQYYSVSAYFGASATSTNGLVWSLNSGTFDVNTSAVESPYFADSFFYVYVASGKILYRASVSNRYYAADLSTPTTYSLVNFPTIGTTYTGNRTSNVAFDGTTYMIVNVNVGLATLYALTSSDGNTWSTSSSLLSLDDTRPGLVAGATGSFLMYEDKSTSNRSAFTSNSGSTWTGSINLPVGSCYGVSYGNSTYVAVGTDGNIGRIAYSTNGTTWLNTYATSGTGGRIYAGIYTNLGSGFFIAGGNAGTGGSAILYSDATGTTWTNATVGGSRITGVIVLEIIDGGASASPRFVALLSTSSTQALTSDDGVTWSFVSMVPDIITPSDFSVLASNYNNFVNGRWTFGSYNNGLTNKPYLILTNG
jgi:hypothetical protein